MTAIEKLKDFLATHCASRCLDDDGDRHAVAETLLVLQAFIPDPEVIRVALRDSLEAVLAANLDHGRLYPADMEVVLSVADEISRNGAQAVLAALALQ